jgi:hypothetical protein
MSDRQSETVFKLRSCDTVFDDRFWPIASTQLTAMCLKKSPGSEVRGYQLDCLLHHIFEPLWVRFVMYNFLWCRVA